MMMLGVLDIASQATELSPAQLPAGTVGVWPCGCVDPLMPVNRVI
jgi:hypothetical protein